LSLPPAESASLRLVIGPKIGRDGVLSPPPTGRFVGASLAPPLACSAWGNRAGGEGGREQPTWRCSLGGGCGPLIPLPDAAAAVVTVAVADAVVIAPLWKYAESSNHVCRWG